MQTMSKLYKSFRWAGYTAGLVGLLHILAARFIETDTAVLARNIGWGCLAIMFIFFLCSYVVHIIRLLKR